MAAEIWGKGPWLILSVPLASVTGYYLRNLISCLLSESMLHFLTNEHECSVDLLIQITEDLWQLFQEALSAALSQRACLPITYDSCFVVVMYRYSLQVSLPVTMSCICVRKESHTWAGPVGSQNTVGQCWCSWTKDQAGEEGNEGNLKRLVGQEHGRLG